MSINIAFTKMEGCDNGEASGYRRSHAGGTWVGVLGIIFYLGDIVVKVIVVLLLLLLLLLLLSLLFLLFVIIIAIIFFNNTTTTN